MKPKLGLRQRMAQAETVAELKMLITEARGYTVASLHTTRRWFNTANRRMKQLDGK